MGVSINHLQVYLLYKWTGHDELLQDIWPAVSKAALWLMRTGLPLRLSCTYDIIYLEKYDHTTYNSVMYLLGLRAAEELGRLKDDLEFSRRCRKAFRRGRRRLVEKLWDDEQGYFRAWWDHEKGSPDWLMADSLYGQVWAYSLGLGSLLDKKKMRSHLKKEKELNKTPYGLRVLTTGQRRATDSSTKRGAKYVRAKKNVLKDLDSFHSRTSKVEQRTKYTRGNRTVGFKLEKGFAADERKVGEPSQKADVGISLELRKKVRGSMLKGFESDRREGDLKATRQKKPTRASAVPRDDKKNQVLNSTKETSDNSNTRVTQAKLPHTNCPSLDPKFKFNSIWMGSDSDWTTLQIYLGMLPDVALRQAKKGLEHYRTGLRDLWNIHGLTAGSGHGLDGQPWCTSHYSFHMVLWHIPFAVSGQQYSAVERTLHFEPKMKVPYVLPFFTPFASGLLESSTRRGKILHKVTVMSGKLELKSLTVSQSSCPSKYQLSLKTDDYVEWTRD